MSEGREEHLAGLAAMLGLELPAFQGPLEAFELGGTATSENPVYLGGDLHAAQPDSATRRPRERDPSLDAALIILDDPGHPRGGSVEIFAVEGVWCLPLPDRLREVAPTFAIWDTDGRLRTWLFLPAARTMIGSGHLWLSEVSPR